VWSPNIGVVSYEICKHGVYSLYTDCIATVDEGAREAAEVRDLRIVQRLKDIIGLVVYDHS